MKNFLTTACVLLSFLFSTEIHAQGPTCETATPFCTSVGTPFTYVNSTTGNLGTVKCLQNTPGPNWFYVKTTVPGTYVFSITQSTSPGGSPNIDVDFVAFGPYSAPQCSFGSGGGGLTNDCSSVGTPWGEVEDCSYCWDPTETMTLHPTANCQLYMILVTNYSHTAGYITFTQTSGPATDCNITTPPSWTPPAPLCADAAPVNLNTLLDVGTALGGTWSGTNVSGNIFDPSTAGPGSYTITYSINVGLCPNAQSHIITVISGSTPTFSALGPYCVGAPAGTLPATSSNGITGTWNPSTISTANAGTTTYTFTPTAGQCSAPVTMSITVSTGITPVFTQLGPYCVGATPGTLSTTSINGITGTWSPSTINTSTLGTTVYTFTPAAGQCGIAVTMPVTVASSITPVFDPLGPYCVGDNPDVLPTSSTNGINGTWNPATINTATAGTTIYTFTPASGQCGITATMSVVVGIDILPVFTALGPYCAGDTPEILPSTSNNGISGTWDPSSISTSSAGTVVYTFTPAAGQCAISNTMSVEVNANITPVFEPLGPYCIGDTPGILPSTSTNGIAGTWNPATISTSVPGNHSYIFTATGGQCNSGSTMIINIISNIINATASPQHICAGQSTTLTVAGFGAYTWIPGNLTGNQVVVTPATTTTYTVNGGISNCTSSVTITIDVDPSIDVTYTADIFSGCEDLHVQFTDLSNADSVSWYWEFGDNSFSYEQNPEHVYFDPGIYDVFLVITTGNGCVFEYIWDNMISVFKMPIAEFVMAPETTSELEPLIWFFDRSIDADSWNWNFGEDYSLNNNSYEQNPVHEYTDTGQFVVTLVAISDKGCMDTARHSVIIEPNVTIYVPNAFTPNNDGKNSNFICKGEGINWDTYEMRIFDRWGKQLLYSHDYELGWNGEYESKQVPEGVYTWLISFTDVKNKRHNLKGIVTLIK